MEKRIVRIAKIRAYNTKLDTLLQKKLKNLSKLRPAKKCPELVSIASPCYSVAQPVAEPIASPCYSVAQPVAEPIASPCYSVAEPIKKRVVQPKVQKTKVQKPVRLTSYFIDDDKRKR